MCERERERNLRVLPSDSPSLSLSFLPFSASSSRSCLSACVFPIDRLLVVRRVFVSRPRAMAQNGHANGHSNGHHHANGHHRPSLATATLETVIAELCREVGLPRRHEKGQPRRSGDNDPPSADTQTRRVGRAIRRLAERCDWTLSSRGFRQSHRGGQNSKLVLARNRAFEYFKNQHRPSRSARRRCRSRGARPHARSSRACATSSATYTRQVRVGDTVGVR